MTIFYLHYNLKSMIKTLIILQFLAFSFITQARIRDFSTTRLKAASGAGIGSLLLDEATVLNPAPLAFYNNSSIYYQNIKSTISNSDIKNLEAPAGKAYILTDAKGGLKGSVSLIDYSEFGESRKEKSISLASLLTQRSSIGFTVKKIEQSIFNNGTLEEEDFYRTSLGITHLLTKEFSMGLLLKDVFNKKPEINSLGVGFQYVFQDFLSLIADFSSNHNEDLSENLAYRAGVQFKVYDNFFLRVGSFNDTGLKQKGNSIGISWTGPKLLIDFAIVNSEFEENIFNNQSKLDLKESSFSVALYF